MRLAWRCVRGWVLCARLDAMCAARRCMRSALCLQLALYSLVFFGSLQRDTDVVFLRPANLARRCYGPSDEPSRRDCVEPNVDWSRLLAVVDLSVMEFQLQRWCRSVQRQWFSDALVRRTSAFALSALFVFVC